MFKAINLYFPFVIRQKIWILFSYKHLYLSIILVKYSIKFSFSICCERFCASVADGFTGIVL